MSETPNLHVSKNLNISKTKEDIEKLKTPLRLVWKCCSVVFKIGSKIFSLQWHFNHILTSLLMHIYAKNDYMIVMLFQDKVSLILCCCKKKYLCLLVVFYWLHSIVGKSSNQAQPAKKLLGFLFVADLLHCHLKG